MTTDLAPQPDQSLPLIPPLQLATMRIRAALMPELHADLDLLLEELEVERDEGFRANVAFANAMMAPWALQRAVADFCSGVTPGNPAREPRILGYKKEYEAMVAQLDIPQMQIPTLEQARTLRRQMEEQRRNGSSEPRSAGPEGAKEQ